MYGLSADAKENKTTVREPGDAAQKARFHRSWRAGGVETLLPGVFDKVGSFKNGPEKLNGGNLWMTR